MAIEQEIWQADIVEAIYAQNPHLNLCVNADQFVLAGKVVHKPQAGTVGSVSRNRDVLPAEVKRRKDTDKTYSIDQYTSDPILITDAETVQHSYDKRSSVLAGTKNEMAVTVGNMMLYNWSPTKASGKIKTTGRPVKAHLEAGTGYRRAFTSKDLKGLKLRFDKWGIPADQRYIILDPDMYEQFTDSLTETQYRDFSQYYDATTGVIGKLYTFNILQRTHVLGCTADGTTIDPLAYEPAASDSAGALAWHQSSVERALGENKFFETLGDATYYGDIYSSLVYMGGMPVRSDEKGVVLVYQDTYTVQAWAAGTKYAVGDIVKESAKTYICQVGHTASEAFATDAAKWEEDI